MTDGSTPDTPLGVGEVICGKYRIERVLGAGGMGVVFAATHLQLEQQVAIKCLRPEMLSNAEVVARFLREARAAVRIQSEHVSRVVDVAETERGIPFMVMEYLQGDDFSTIVAQRGPLPWKDVVNYVLQACEAVAQAHRLGIVHRDLKPSNLFLAAAAVGPARIKVLDFGISKVLSDKPSSPALTGAASVMGSPLYMSPEQMKSSANVDVRSDIWAIGVILFELLTAHVPFPGEGLSDVIAKVLTEEPPTVRTLRPEVPEVIEAIVSRCLQKDPAKRYASIGELAVALAQASGDSRSTMLIERIVEASPVDPGGTRGGTVVLRSDPPGRGIRAATTGVGGVASSAASLARPNQRRTASVLIGLAVAGVSIGLAALFLLTRPDLTGVEPAISGATEPSTPWSASAANSLASLADAAPSAAMPTETATANSVTAVAAVGKAAGSDRAKSSSKGGSATSATVAAAASASPPPTVAATPAAPTQTQQPPPKKSPLDVSIK